MYEEPSASMLVKEEPIHKKARIIGHIMLFSNHKTHKYAYSQQLLAMALFFALMLARSLSSVYPKLLDQRLSQTLSSFLWMTGVLVTLDLETPQLKLQTSMSLQHLAFFSTVITFSSTALLHEHHCLLGNGRITSHQWNLPEDIPLGVNINVTLLPAKLKQAGYKTHMVGKWHEGFFKKAYLPVNRGFDTSSGFLGGGENHFTHRAGCAYDFWKNASPDSRVESYDAYHYHDDLNDIFANHDQQNPPFLYLHVPLHNVHAPFQAPAEWLDLYKKNSTCNQRRTYQAMVSVADNVTGLVVYWLKEKGMWENTLLVVSADNGGAPCGGSNYPLKGCKGTFFEGGVRALAFANGGLIPKEMQGKSIDGFIHIADWYPTFCKMAGVDPDDSGPGKFAVDGVDV